MEPDEVPTTCPLCTKRLLLAFFYIHIWDDFFLKMDWILIKSNITFMVHIFNMFTCSPWKYYRVIHTKEQTVDLYRHLLLYCTILAFRRLHYFLQSLINSLAQIWSNPEIIHTMELDKHEWQCDNKNTNKQKYYLFGVFWTPPPGLD